MAWQRLTYLSDHFGARLSGSKNLERAIDWAVAGMRQDGLKARREPVLVPVWVRGAESAQLLEPAERDLGLLGLGGSIGTPPEGITAEVLVVGSFKELEADPSRARGRIVLFNAPFTTYGETVGYRWEGAARAARAGAVACLIRSVSPVSLSTPHTGSMGYSTDTVRIPAAALALEDAEMLGRMAARGERVVLRLRMGAHTLPDAESANVVAEIRGRERPDEVVLMGGHIDSWDVGSGAMDDGGGCVAAWEALRLIKALGLKPRRTIRVVLWTNEENGLRGALAYRDAHAKERHVLAIESDSGVFRPKGFSFTGPPEMLERVRGVAGLLEGIGASTISQDGHGADIAPLMERGVPGMHLEVEDETYFHYHHSAADTPDKLKPEDLKLCSAALAVMAYLVADLDVPPSAATAR